MSLARIAAKQSPPYSRMRSGKRGVKDGNFRSGRSSSTSASRSPMPSGPPLSVTNASPAPSSSLQQLFQLFGHAGLEFEPDHAAPPPPLDRAAEIADQILGLFLDLDDRCRAARGRRRTAHLVAGEQHAGEAPDQRFDRDVARRVAAAGGRSAAAVAGSITSSRISSPSDLRTRSKITLVPLLGMNGNGCAGSSAWGVRIGKICSPKWRSQPVAARPQRPISVSSTWIPAAASSWRRSRQTCCWLADQRVGLLGDRGQLLRRGQPVGRSLLDVLHLLSLEPRDADHEEFVEIVARDRQEAQPFEQRMRGIARFFQHAAVERQPAQLAVEIAVAVCAERIGSSSSAGTRALRCVADVMPFQPPGPPLYPLSARPRRVRRAQAEW